jgi:hypothetical protein
VNGVRSLSFVNQTVSGISASSITAISQLLNVMDQVKPLVVLIGSSVAEGCYAPTGKGWADFLGQYLEQIGFLFTNEAVSGMGCFLI